MGLNTIARKYPIMMIVETATWFCMISRHISSMANMEKRLQTKAIRDKKSSQRINDFRLK